MPPAPARNRRSLRLPGYDYGQPGAYFLTLCTWQRTCLFGEVVNGSVQLSDLGRIVSEEWTRTAEIRPEIRLDEYVIMPNHLHAILFILEAGSHAAVGAHGRAPLRRTARSLASLVAGFKSICTKRLNLQRGMPGVPVWQRNYYEHVIRADDSLDAIRRYVSENPLRWAEDEENPAYRQP